MAAPHNPERYGEVWDPAHVAACEADLERIRDLVVVSGGWAWHFMSPPNHLERKHAHDHKDVDLFVPPAHVAELSDRLRGMGYARVQTRFDRRPAPYPFRRLARPVGKKAITIDLFTGEPPHRTLEGGWRVVDPAHLITLYKTVHGSDTCFAVKAAARLLQSGVDPVGHPDLVAIPSE